jgi:HK97 family phage portal protein
MLFDQHPWLLDRIAIWRSQDATGEEGNYNFQSGAYDYIRTGWVMKAVQVVASSIAPLRLMVVDNQDIERKGHQLTEFLARGNAAGSQADLWHQWAVDIQLGGEFGIEFTRTKSGKLVNMWGHQPSCFSIFPDAKRRAYYIPAGYRVYRTEEDGHTTGHYDLDTDEFLHLKSYNPTNPWRGIGRLHAVRIGVRIDQQSNRWSKAFFENGARPDYAISSEDGFTVGEAADIEKKLAERHGYSNADGTSNWHKPLVLSGPVSKIEKFTFPPKDLEWVNQRRMARDEIGAVFGVPDEIMGHGRDTYENFDTAERVLWTVCLIPWINLRDDKLTWFFRRAGLISGEEKVATDLSRVWPVRRAMNSAIQQAKVLASMFVPFNRIDEYLSLGIGNIPGGDVGLGISGNREVADQPNRRQSASAANEPAEE